MANDDKTGNESEGSQLRKQLEDALELNRKLTTKLVVNESGIDVGKPLAKLFVDKYDGEWTVDAFTAQAKEYGLIEDQGDAAGSEAVASSGGGGQDEKSGSAASTHQSQFDAIFNATGEGGGSLPAEKPKWADAKSAQEFMATYDGRVQ